MGLVEFILQKQQQMMTLNEHGFIDDEFIADIFGQIIEQVIICHNKILKEVGDLLEARERSEFRGYDKTSYKRKLEAKK